MVRTDSRRIFAGQILDRNFDCDGIHVEARYCVGSDVEVVVGILGWPQNSATGSGADVEAVKGSAEVDEERIG